MDPADQPDRPDCPVPGPAQGLSVADEFGLVVPVSPKEIEVIETYLGAMLDALLNGKE